MVPRLNPDGAEAMLAKVNAGKKTNATPRDGENDGRMDEDGGDDLNGDGLITVMRVKDPHGQYIIDPENPALMKRADASKGENGTYSIYWEGLDNDGDGFYNEDPAGGTDLNRNFQHAYPYYKDDAGMNMIGESETRALMDWVLAHKNISMVLTIGESDNLINPPSSRGQISSDRGLDLVNFANASMAGASRVGMMSAGGRGFGRFGGGFMMGGGSRGSQRTTEADASGRTQRPASQPATTVNTADIPYFTKVSEKYKELTGIKTAPVLRNPEGAFFQFAYFQFGVPAFSTPGWGLVIPEDTANRRGMRRPGGSDAPTGNAAAMTAGRSTAGARMGAGFAGQTGGAGPAGEGGQAAGIDAEFLKYVEASDPKGFVAWTTVQHPDFGEVEVGGFNPFAVANPPFEKVADLAKSHADFAVWMTTLNARVKIAKTEVLDQGGGLFRIKAEVENLGFLPTALRHGVSARAVAPTMVQLGVDKEQILTGNDKTNFFQALEGSGGVQKYEWLIKGKKGDQITLKVISQKAGSDQATLTLK